MSAPRRIFLDDTDPSIRYSANQWFPRDVNSLKLGNLGDVWNGTSMATSDDGATLSFAFNGTSIQLIGTIETKTDDLGNVDPTWVCLVDEIPISNGTDPTFKFPENNWVLCDQPKLLPGEHTLTVKVQSKGQPFYADSIVYTPMPDARVDGAVVEYTFGDPAITYGPGWQFFTIENTQNITQTKGAQVSFDFHGTAVSLTGYVPFELPHNATTAKYAIDNGPETTFTLQGLLPEATTTVFNVPMFSVGSLPAGDHTIVVTYEGDVTKTPLVVKTFYVTNATSPAAPVPGSSSSSAAGVGPSTGASNRGSGTGSNNSASSHSQTPTAAIAGGTVAAMLVLAILGVFLFLRRRRRRREEINRRRDPFTIEAAEVGGGGGATGTGTGTTLGTSRNPFDPYSEVRATSSPYSTYPTPSASTGGSGLQADNTATRASGTTRSFVALNSSSSPTSSSGGGVAAAAAALSPKAREAATQRDGPVIMQRHEDSGVRLNSTPSLLMSPRVVELPPNYSRE
ncbi:hypothetical protein MKEN_00268400 [Mycena kentingensis (nom. inval.)]|nr:hypothetical protein MKEN_00268400 [Mycena kentingensis (nom. inval.)]